MVNVNNMNAAKNVNNKENSNSAKNYTINIHDFHSLSSDYKPLENEDYMCFNHKVYFYGILMNMREQNFSDLEKINASVESLRDFSDSDEFDIASRYTEISNSMTQIERLTANIREIDRLISKIQEGKYGYCEDSGEKIGLKRLIAMPLATKSLALQKNLETQRIIAKNAFEDDE